MNPSLIDKKAMGILFHFLLGFLTSFLGTIFPSMLSMTTVKISIKETRKKAISFAAGVAVIVIIQAYIAVGFSKLLTDNPEYLNSLQKAATIIFTGLAIYFFIQALKTKKPQTTTQKKIKGFFSGLIFSSLNMFAIPFYFGVTSSLVMIDWYEFLPNNNFAFVIGSSLGTFFLLFLYSGLAKKIERRMTWLANKMDFILGIVTALVAIFNTIDLLL